MLPSLFSLNHTPTAARPLYGTSPNSWDQKALDRSVQGLIAVLLSLKKKPVIRYEKSSPMAKKLGVEIQVGFVVCQPELPFLPVHCSTAYKQSLLCLTSEGLKFPRSYSSSIEETTL